LHDSHNAHCPGRGNRPDGRRHAAARSEACCREASPTGTAGAPSVAIGFAVRNRRLPYALSPGDALKIAVASAKGWRKLSEAITPSLVRLIPAASASLTQPQLDNRVNLDYRIVWRRTLRVRVEAMPSGPVRRVTPTPVDTEGADH